jgi:hypothetical protein
MVGRDTNPSLQIVLRYPAISPLKCSVICSKRSNLCSGQAFLSALLGQGRPDPPGIPSTSCRSAMDAISSSDSPLQISSSFSLQGSVLLQRLNGVGGGMRCHIRRIIDLDQPGNVY